MVQQGILGLIIILISSWVVLDLTEKYQLHLNTEWKLEYLETLNSPDQFEAYFSYFLSNIDSRASLKENYSSFLEIDPCLINFKDSVKWERFIDEEDLKQFTADIRKLPSYNKKKLLSLDSIRNKMIYNQLLSYVVEKTWRGNICCFGQYFINKDIYNNISLGDHSCGLYREKIMINGQSHIAVKPYLSTTILQSDTLHKEQITT